MSERLRVLAQRGQRPLILSVLALLAVAAALSLPTMGPASAGPAPNAVAKIITNPQDLIEGPMSRGTLGDYLLANGEIQVVIQKPERSLMVVGTFGGQILDADLVRLPGDPVRDAFEE